MMNSMTGFATVSGEAKGYRFCLEARSFNHRFFEFKCRLPVMLNGLEYALEEMAGKYFERGKIELVITVESEPETIELKWSKPAAKAYLKIFRQMQKQLGIAGKIDLPLLISQKDVILSEARRWGKESPPELEKLFRRGFEALAEARRREGLKLESDLAERLSRIEQFWGKIRAGRECFIEEAKSRLQKRVGQLLGECTALEPGRLEQEVAILASRSDIAEELDRIQSHFRQFRKEMGQAGAKGKKLDFLTQEMNREFNTIGAKGQNAELAQIVIEAKTELERIRQQLQNIE